MVVWNSPQDIYIKLSDDAWHRIKEKDPDEAVNCPEWKEILAATRKLRAEYKDIMLNVTSNGLVSHELEKGKGETLINLGTVNKDQQILGAGWRVLIDEAARAFIASKGKWEPYPNGFLGNPLA